MSARVILTYDDYAALPDDGHRYELYEGELVTMPSPRPRHQVVIGNLHTLMADHVRGHGLGQVYLSPIDVILSRITVLQPDLVYVERARLGIVTERAIEGAPTLVVEVLSPSTNARDRGVKQALYARYGVPFYWIVDPDARTMQALRLSGESYEADGQARRNDACGLAAADPPDAGSGRRLAVTSEASNSILLVPEPLGIDATCDAAVRTQRAFGDEEDHPTLVEHGDPHPGAEPESFTHAAWQDELILTGKPHGLHRLTRMLNGARSACADAGS